MPYYEHGGGNYQYFPPGGLYQGVEDRCRRGGLPPLGFSSFDHHLQLHHHYEEEQEEDDSNYDSNHGCNQEVHDCAADNDRIGNINNDNTSNDSYNKKRKNQPTQLHYFGRLSQRKEK